MGYKRCKFFENRARDTPLPGVYIAHFLSNLSKKFQFWGFYTLVVAPMGVKFGTEEGARFHPDRCNVSPLRGEKPKNRPVSKLNTGSVALRAMPPVTRTHQEMR